MHMQKIGVAWLGMALLAGCAATSPKAPALSADEQAQYAKTTPAQLLASAEAHLQKAGAAAFATYAPGALARIEAQVRELREYSKKPDADKSHIIAINKSVEQDFNAGQANKQVVQTQLADVLGQKQILDEIQTSKTYPGDYQDAIEDMMDLVKYIESGKADKARSKAPGVMESMKKLEIRVVRENSLGKVKTMLAKAKDQDADDLAQKSYEEAEKAYDRANLFISTNPRDSKEISRLSTEALFYATRSVSIAASVAKLKQVKPDDMEIVALETEQLLHRIATALHQDVRDQSPYEQSVALANLAEKLTAESGNGQENREQLSKLKTELEALQKKNAALAAQLAQTESANKAAAENTPSPATQPSPADQQPPTADKLVEPEAGQADPDGTSTPPETASTDAPAKATETSAPNQPADMPASAPMPHSAQ